MQSNPSKLSAASSTGFYVPDVLMPISETVPHIGPWTPSEFQATLFYYTSNIHKPVVTVVGGIP
jgi:hypothetical protein